MLLKQYKHVESYNIIFKQLASQLYISTEILSSISIILNSNYFTISFQSQIYYISVQLFGTMEEIQYGTFSLKSQEVKFNAFFEYLKSFSQAGLETLTKLQTQFNKKMRSKSKETQTLTIMKNLLAAYEIFILCTYLKSIEIKDSCEFIEIPEFGFCISKTFLQLIKIIKWFLSRWMRDNFKYEKLKEKIDNIKKSEDKQFEPIFEENLVCSFCQQIIKNPYAKNNKSKRRGVAAYQANEDAIKKAKRIHFTQKDKLMEFKQNVIERYTMKEIESKKFINDPDMDIINRKHIAMRMQSTNNETVLEEVLHEFNLKTQAMSRFVTNSQSICVQSLKYNHEKDYQHFEEQMKELIEEKSKIAKNKLKSLIQLKIIQHQKFKKSKLADQSVQTTPMDNLQKDRLEVKIKQMTANIQKLKNQLESQKNLVESLKKLLESKSIQFESQFLNFRKQVIIKELQSKNILKSLKSLRQIVEDYNNQQLKHVDRPSISLQKQIKIKQNISSKTKVSCIKKQMKNRKDKAYLKFENNQSPSDFSDDSNHQIGDTNYEFDSKTKTNTLTKNCEVQTDNHLFSNYIDSSQNSKSKFDLTAASTETHKFQKIGQIKLNEESNKKYLKKYQQTYSHIKSKVYNNKQTSTIRPKVKQRVSAVGSLVKKLSLEILQTNKKQISIPIYKLDLEPKFYWPSQIKFSNEDIQIVYLNQKNAHNYQCLNYRNSMFNLVNLNPKRANNSNFRLQMGDVDWNFKKQYSFSDSIQIKLANAFFNQINMIKRKDKYAYQEIKKFMRHPFEYCKTIEIINLKDKQEKIVNQNGNIQLCELKKIMKIILKFHKTCVGDSQEVVCDHIITFFNKIGISFI